MKKSYLLFLLAAGLLGSANAQTTVVDSIQTGGSYANDVFYSLENGEVKSLANSDWQLAFSIGNFNVGVRANTAAGSTRDGQVTMYEMPDADTTQWATFDTANYASTWAVLDNSDEEWENGALNQNPTSQFDYGWGIYNTASHVIEGHRLYLAVVTSGSTTLYKKVWVLNKTMGVWNVRFANIDGTDSHDVQMASSAYSTKNFVYLSLVTGNIVDREPAKTEWDFVLTRYAALQPTNPPVYYASIGILSNAGIAVSEVRGLPEATTTLADTVAFSENISTIGADWKQLNAQFAFEAVDSLTYFVKKGNGDIWKLVFTKFTSGSSPSGTGRAVFNKTRVYKNTTAVNEVSTIKTFTVYPNPAAGEVNLLMDIADAQTDVVITDLSGRTVYTDKVEGAGFIRKAIDLSSLQKGIYFINVTNGTSRSVQKVILN